MAILIPDLIPEQGFEKVRDRIGEIITTEFANQLSLLHPTNTPPHKVFVERFAKIDSSDGIVINVGFNDGQLDKEDVISSNWIYTYSIDLYLGKKSSPIARGDSQSLISLERGLGIIRSILRDSRYKRLGFLPPFVLRRSVGRIQVATPDKFKDTLSTTMGRVTISVLVTENEGVSTAENIAEWITQVKLSDSEQGFVFTESE